MEEMRKGHPRIEIKSADDFNMICEDLLNEYIEDFERRQGLTREPNQEDNDEFDREMGYMMTQAGMGLYDRACKRLSELGLKYFDAEDLDIKSSNLLFP